MSTDPHEPTPKRATEPLAEVPHAQEDLSEAGTVPHAEVIAPPEPAEPLEGEAEEAEAGTVPHAEVIAPPEEASPGEEPDGPTEPEAGTVPHAEVIAPPEEASEGDTVPHTEVIAPPDVEEGVELVESASEEVAAEEAEALPALEVELPPAEPKRFARRRAKAPALSFSGPPVAVLSAAPPAARVRVRRKAQGPAKPLAAPQAKARVKTHKTPKPVITAKAKQPAEPLAASPEPEPPSEAVVDAHTDAPRTDAAQTDAAQSDAPQTDAPQTDAPQTDAPQTDAPQTDAPEASEPEALAASAKTEPGEAPEAAPEASKKRGPFGRRKRATKVPKRRNRKKPSVEVQAKLKERTPTSPRKRERPGLIETLHRSPAYGVAAFVHVLVLVALSFWTIAVHLKKEANVDVRMAPSRTVLPTENLEERQQAQAAAEKSLQNTLSGSNDDSPFAEAQGEVAGALKGQASKVLGLSGGKGGGLGRGGSGGDSQGSRTAIHAGLDWLVRHRTKDGGWRALGEDHSDPSTIPTRGGNVGQTGLALLAFLCADHGPDKETPYKEVIHAARKWLLKNVGSGDFNRPRFNHLSTYYERAIGTLALAEWLQRAPQDEEVKKALVSCVAHLTESRDPGRGGWRYRPRAGSDTSVTSWVMLALKSARHAKVDVPEENFQGAKIWVDSVTNQETGTTGYVAVGDGRENGAMAATGLFLRILLGDEPNSRINRLAVKHVQRIRVSAWKGKVGNLYEVYYGALAMYQVGGRTWRRFNPKIRDALVLAQHRQGCERGGWKGSSWVSEPVAATAIAILTLETYYRYIPQHGSASESAGEKALDEAHGLMDELEEAAAKEKSTKDDLNAKALAVQAAYARAVSLLEPTKDQDWDLLAEAYVGQARLFAREADVPAALEQLKKAKDLTPPGEPPLPSILELEGRLHLLSTIQEAEQAIAQAQELSGRKDAKREDRVKCLDRLRSARLNLAQRAVRARLDDTGRETVRSLSSALEAAQTLLMTSEDRDALLDRELGRLQARKTLPKTLESWERRLILLLIQRAHDRYLLARTKENKARYDQAEADRLLLQYLAPLRRGDAADRARLQQAMEQLHLSRAATLAGLKDVPRALKALQEYRERFPQGKLSEESAQLERALLISLGPLESLSDAQRARLRVLILDAGKKGLSLSPLELLTLGGLLLEEKQPREAAKAFGSAGAATQSVSIRRAAKLGRSRALRALGQANLALAELNSLPADDNQRLDVILERCAILRLQKKFEPAIKEYVLVMQALEHEDAQAWWDLAEELARTYVEARKPREARRFLEALNERDRTFGGKPARRERMIQLMREVDLMASRGG